MQGWRDQLAGASYQRYIGTGYQDNVSSKRYTSIKLLIQPVIIPSRAWYIVYSSYNCSIKEHKLVPQCPYFWS